MSIQFAHSEKLVRWPQLESTFKKLFPRAVQDVIDNGHTAHVLYLGIPFSIRPTLDCTCDKLEHICPACCKWAARGFIGADNIMVFGAPFINDFPDSP